MARAETDDTGTKVKKPKAEASGNGNKKKPKTGNNRPSVSRRKSTRNRKRMENGVSSFMRLRADPMQRIVTKTDYRKLLKAERRTEQSETVVEQKAPINIAGVSKQTLKKIGLEQYASE